MENITQKAQYRMIYTTTSNGLRFCAGYEVILSPQ